MDFRILGPLEVSDGERLLRLGGTKRRAALALLILNANKVVGADRFVDDLWGEDTPSHATSALHTHISRLRKELGGEVLVSHGWGYALHTPPETIDLNRFERTVAEAHALPAVERASQLSRALALWRGSPLADLTFEPSLANDVARLEERRLVVYEQRIDADLDAGRDGDLVGELESLISEHPLREHFRWQLILALYRGGRQAEALEAYRETRRFLAQELGLEPSAKLRELERAILSQDPALNPPERPAPAAEQRRELAAELDPATPILGRAAELRLLRSAWARARAGDGGAVFLRGAAGIGKTRLAAELAREVHGRGHAVLYARCAEDDAERVFREAAGAGSPTLLVADDLDRAGRRAADAILPLLPELASRPVLLLGTYSEEGTPLVEALLAHADPSGEWRREVPPLAVEEVRSLVSIYAGPSDSEIPLDELVEATQGIPARVHRAAREWADGRVSGRLTDSAERTASSRADLRAAERALAESAVEFQHVRSQSSVFAEAPQHVPCPFKGLVPFETGDAEYFFGRERLVAEIVARLVGAWFVAVIGQSGSGKSSAVRAGLVPSLAAGIIPGSETWHQAVIRPGADPMAALATVADDAGTETLVVIDQFEEIFTECDDEEQRRRFVAAVTERRERLRFVVVLRADFYSRCAPYGDLAVLLAGNQVLVGPMKADELRRAVEFPARLAGLRVEPELVDVLVDDVLGEPGGLPLLSTTLLELWQAREGRSLTMKAYRERGGVRGALVRRAEEAYLQLDDAQQTLARAMLCRLAAPTAGLEAARRRVPLSELDVDTSADAAHVLAVLVRARLLTTSDDGVEVAHEALLREWPRLRSWLEDDAEGRRLHAHLMRAARDWDERGRDQADLYRGARLGGALDWMSSHPAEPNETERQFLQASRAAAERHAERQRREIRRLRILLAAVVLLLGGALAAGVVALSLRSDAKSEARAADVRALANAAEANLSVDPDRSLLLALQASRRVRDADGSVFTDALQALGDAIGAARTLALVDGAGGGVAAGPEGMRFATEGKGGDPAVWDAATGKRLFGLGRDVAGVAYGSEGTRVATAGVDGTATLWNAATGKPVRTFSGAADALLVSAEFGRADHLLATLSELGEVVVWDVASGRKLLRRRAWSGPTPSGLQAEGLAFSADGARLAAVGAGAGGAAATVWDVDTGRTLLGLPARGDHPRDVDLSPDGSILALGFGDGRFELRDAATGRLRGGASGHDGDVWDVEFSPDGTRLATGGNDGFARLWSIGGGGLRPLLSLAGHRAAVEKVSFSGDGARLFTGSDDGTARVWDIASAGPRALRMFAGPPYTFSGALAFSASGRVAAPSADGRSVRLLDPASGRQVARFSARGDRVQKVAVSPDGATVAATSADGTIEAWDTEARRRLFATTLTGCGEPPCVVTQPVFSPDGSVLAVGGDDGRVRILGSGAGRVLRTVGTHQGPVVNVAFSPDGEHVASASADGTARIWERAGGKHLLTLDAGPAELADLGFSGDGSKVVTAGWDGRLRLWDSHGGRLLRVWPARQGDLFDLAVGSDDLIATTGDAGRVRLWNLDSGEGLVSFPSPGQTAVAFSDDGKRIASLAAGGHTVSIWPLTVDELTALGRSRVMRSLTVEECRRYLDTSNCASER